MEEEELVKCSGEEVGTTPQKLENNETLQKEVVPIIEKEYAANKEEGPIQEEPITEEVVGTLLKFVVMFNRKKHNITWDETSSIELLKEHIESLTTVPKKMQKLIFKVQLKDTQTLAEAKITNGTKVMLLGTAEKEVLSANKKFKAETGGTVTASTTTKKQPLCEQKLHKRIVDQGKPDDAMPAYVNGTEALPRVAVTGMKNKAGNKVRLTFKLTADEVWISTKERTEKVGMSSIRSIVFEPIKGHEEYHIMGFGVGTTESSRYWIYWVPAQYVKAIKSTIMDN